jgi:hypothetical protein
MPAHTNPHVKQRSASSMLSRVRGECEDLSSHTIDLRGFTALVRETEVQRGQLFESIDLDHDGSWCEHQSSAMKLGMPPFSLAVPNNPLTLRPLSSFSVLVPTSLSPFEQCLLSYILCGCGYIDTPRHLQCLQANIQASPSRCNHTSRCTDG